MFKTYSSWVLFILPFLSGPCHAVPVPCPDSNQYIPHKGGNFIAKSPFPGFNFFTIRQPTGNTLSSAYSHKFGYVFACRYEHGISMLDLPNKQFSCSDANGNVDCTPR